jgi:CheY-like chemotaxis protein
VNVTGGHAGAHRILVVEDDEDVRGALSAMLQGEGYDVVEAVDGCEALQRLRGGAPVCLILLDIFMPGMDGWAFRAEQMKDPALADIPVLVITADSAAATEALARGAVSALTKPVEFDRLLRVVEQHC